MSAQPCFKCGDCLHVYLRSDMNEDPSKWCPACGSARYYEAGPVETTAEAVALFAFAEREGMHRKDYRDPDHD